jgi:hypothetical protein
MNFNTQSPAVLGGFLIALGVVAWFGLWSLLLPAALLIGGVVAYQQRRRLGRTIEAVQVGMWGVGLALLFLIGFVWPGILFLAGASVLIRGREDRVDAYVQNAIAQARRPRATRPVTSQRVEISTNSYTPSTPVAPAQPRPVERDVSPVSGETTRL